MGWLVQLGRSQASKDAEILVLRGEKVLGGVINEYHRAAQATRRNPQVRLGHDILKRYRGRAFPADGCRLCRWTASC